MENTWITIDVVSVDTETQKYCTIARLKVHRNSLLPMFSIPAEVLGEIFISAIFLPPQHLRRNGRHGIDTGSRNFYYPPCFNVRRFANANFNEQSEFDTTISPFFSRYYRPSTSVAFNLPTIRLLFLRFTRSISNINADTNHRHRHRLLYILSTRNLHAIPRRMLILL